MGKIKSKSIKRTAQILHKQEIGYSSNFEDNKKILEGMPSKKIRNQMAGLLAKMKKKEIIDNAKNQ